MNISFKITLQGVLKGVGLFIVVAIVVWGLYAFDRAPHGDTSSLSNASSTATLYNRITNLENEAQQELKWRDQATSYINQLVAAVNKLTPR